MAQSRIASLITYIVQLGGMAFASYCLYCGLNELPFVNPQAATYFAVSLFATLCVLDMVITDKTDLHEVY